jgi:hypothetical protein
VGLLGPLVVLAGVYYGFRSQRESNEQQAKLQRSVFEHESKQREKQIEADRKLEKTRLSQGYWSEVLKICMEATELGGRIAAGSRVHPVGAPDDAEAIRRFRVLLYGRTGIIETVDGAAPKTWPFRRAMDAFSERLDKCERSPKSRCGEVLTSCTEGIAFACSKILCELLPDEEDADAGIDAGKAKGIAACGSSTEPLCPSLENDAGPGASK